MKKMPLVILFVIIFLVQIFFPLKTIQTQYLIRTYGETDFEDVKLNSYISDENYLSFENDKITDHIFLKKDTIKFLKELNCNLSELKTKLKVKKLGNNRSIIDLIVEDIPLKNAKIEDLIPLKEKSK